MLSYLCNMKMEVLFRSGVYKTLRDGAIGMALAAFVSHEGIYQGMRQSHQECTRYDSTTSMEVITWQTRQSISNKCWELISEDGWNEQKNAMALGLLLGLMFGGSKELGRWVEENTGRK